MEKLFFFNSCTARFYVTKSFICPTNAQLNCFKMLKFTGAFILNLNVNFNILKEFNF